MARLDGEIVLLPKAHIVILQHAAQINAAAAATAHKAQQLVQLTTADAAANATSAADDDEDEPEELPPPTALSFEAAARTGPHPDAGKLPGIMSASEEADKAFKQVQTFESKGTCAKWSSYHTRCTNPKYPQCDQLYTTVCDWEQACDLILKPLAALRARLPHDPSSIDVPAGNRFASSREMLVGLRSRTRLPVHEAATDESTINTLRYLFFHMRCGIFVAVRRSKVRMFVPFVNKDYSNNWGDKLVLEKNFTVDEYYHAKRAKAGRVRERPLKDKRLWWANGNIMCNEASARFWGDSYLTQLRHMLERTCAERDVADCEFFINKRDFPHLKKDLSEPYDFLFERDGVPLFREAWASMAPICSFFVSHEFADLPIVTTDDWETATGVVFPPVGTDLRSMRNRKRHNTPWADRVATAVFRGNSTGPGTTPETNQRLMLAKLSHEWRKIEKYRPENKLDGMQYLDAGVVQWNLRDRKLQGRPMTFIKGDEMAFPLVKRVPMYMQARYKYQIYVDGHCAAMRYASMMPLGSVILRVESVTKADHMWYFPLLKSHDLDKGDAVGDADHIAVAADLSDLADVLTWCKTHDKACETIANNSTALHARLISREGLLDYTQLVLAEIGRRFHSHGDLAARMGAPAALALELGSDEEEDDDDFFSEEDSSDGEDYDDVVDEEVDHDAGVAASTAPTASASAVVLPTLPEASAAPVSSVSVPASAAPAPAPASSSSSSAAAASTSSSSPAVVIPSAPGIQLATPQPAVPLMTEEIRLARAKAETERQEALLAAERAAARAKRRAAEKKKALRRREARKQSREAARSRYEARMRSRAEVEVAASVPAAERGEGVDPFDPVGDGMGPWAVGDHDWFGASNTGYASARVAASSIAKPTFSEYFARLQRRKQQEERRGKQPADTAKSLRASAMERSRANLARIKARLAQKGAGDVKAGVLRYQKAAGLLPTSGSAASDAAARPDKRSRS
jgi:hypothetical protein